MYLNCKTYFSYRYGVLGTEELVKEAAEAGLQAVALTNINCTADHWDFLDYCRQYAIKPVLGAEIRNGDAFLYVLLAKDVDGIQIINEFISYHLQNKKDFPGRPTFNEKIWIIYPFASAETASLLPNELIGIKPAQLNKLHNQKPDFHKFIILQPVTYKNKTGYNLHRLLRAVDKNIILSKQQPAHLAADDEMLLPPSRLLEQYRFYPSIITNTLQVIDTCQYDFDFHSDKNKKCFSATAEDDRILLEKRALEGMELRYGKKNKQAEKRVKHELEIINKLHFNAYFLITWDIIRYAQSRGFFHVGRGSGANSIVAFCLQITDVDPIELDLYFERFLNPHRASPPDFDIDFSWKDRDEVIDYIFKRYGKEHVALLGMYSTFQHDIIIRELAKVFGLPKAEIDQMVNMPIHQLAEDKIQKQILFYAALLKDFPNYQSIHPGGMVISEKPITQYTATDLPPKGFCTTQIDMFVAEKVGLYKLDILSQRGLAHIRDTVQLVKENKGISIDIHAVEKFKKDREVAAQIKESKTIGCFYIESPAMRTLLKKLRCDNYITLVAASSIIRPGVAQSGMMREYIFRFHNPDKFEYLHPKMKELLEETYGVMVYQEDVIKVAHYFAGVDMAEADILRRAMSGKYRGHKQFEDIRDKFFLLCKEKGYAGNLTREVWRQIESFGGYSFSKAHSASFAVESYQSLYLKTHFPMEFMVAVINNFGGFYSTELYFHELRRSGAKIHAPSVNESGMLTTIRGSDVWMGFVHIKQLSTTCVERILMEKERHGSFISLSDFIERTQAGIEQINLLIRAGAFRFTGKNKKGLLWEANFFHKRSLKNNAANPQLFSIPPTEYKLPEFHHDPFEDALDQIELFDFPLGDVFQLVDDDVKKYVPSKNFHLYSGQFIHVLGYYITQKPVRTIHKEFMYFGTFLDAAGDWIDSVHFPKSAAAYPLQGKGFYHLYGKVTEEFGTYCIDVLEMKKVPWKCGSSTVVQQASFIKTK